MLLELLRKQRPSRPMQKPRVLLDRRVSTDEERGFWQRSPSVELRPLTRHKEPATSDFSSFPRYQLTQQTRGRLGRDGSRNGGRERSQHFCLPARTHVQCCRPDGHQTGQPFDLQAPYLPARQYSRDLARPSVELVKETLERRVACRPDGRGLEPDGEKEPSTND